MKSNTAIADQLAAQGMTREAIQYRIATAKFQNSGGTYNEARAIIDAAYGMGSEGHITSADDGHKVTADVPHMNAAKGREKSADEAVQRLLDAAPERNGVGQTLHIDKAMHCLPTSVSTESEQSEGHDGDVLAARTSLPSPVRPPYDPNKVVSVVHHMRNKPGHTRRNLETIGSVQATIAKSLWDTTILLDGRALRQIRWSECPGLISKSGRQARLLKMIYNHAIPADPNDTLDQCVKESELKDILEQAEKSNDIF